MKPGDLWAKPGAYGKPGKTTHAIQHVVAGRAYCGLYIRYDGDHSLSKPVMSVGARTDEDNPTCDQCALLDQYRVGEIDPEFGPLA